MQIMCIEAHHYVIDEVNIYFKEQALHDVDKMYHVYYEEQDPKGSFFMVEAFWRSIWPTHHLLATD